MKLGAVVEVGLTLVLSLSFCVVRVISLLYCVLYKPVQPHFFAILVFPVLKVNPPLNNDMVLVVKKEHTDTGNDLDTSDHTTDNSRLAMLRAADDVTNSSATGSDVPKVSVSIPQQSDREEGGVELTIVKQEVKEADENDEDETQKPREMDSNLGDGSRGNHGDHSNLSEGDSNSYYGDNFKQMMMTMTLVDNFKSASHHGDNSSNPGEGDWSSQGDQSNHGNPYADLDPNRCPVCGKRMSRARDVKVHMRRHTGETPYRCRCGAAFRSVR
jgi:hypothetical protein